MSAFGVKSRDKTVRREADSHFSSPASEQAQEPKRIISDARSSIESVRRDAESPLLAHRVCRALALGLLPVGVSRSGQWVSQLRFGPLSILCVWLDRRDRRLQSEHARFSGGTCLRKL